jgi:L-lactate permease
MSLLAGILGTVAVIIIAYFSQGIKRFLVALLASFFIAVAVYSFILWFGDKLPDIFLPFFMIIATAIELWRENNAMKQKASLPEKPAYPA